MWRRFILRTWVATLGKSLRFWVVVLPMKKNRWFRFGVMGEYWMDREGRFWVENLQGGKVRAEGTRAFALTMGIAEDIPGFRK